MMESRSVRRRAMARVLVGCAWLAVVSGCQGEGSTVDAGGPEVVAPDLATVDLATVDLATPDLATVDLATVDLATPDLATPDLATPDLTMPDLTMPDLTMPDLTMPDLTMPDLAMPDLGTRHGAALQACRDLVVSSPLRSATAPKLIAGPTGGGVLDTLDTILAPVRDAKPMYVPDGELPAQPYVRCGLLDVTLPPFSADPTGVEDATAALSQALKVASLYQLVVFFPLGTYRVTDTLECVQPLYLRGNGKQGGRRGACYLMGEQTPEGARPRLLLPPSTPGFTSEAVPKNLLVIWARSLLAASTEAQSNISMNNYVVGLDVEIGAGNFGVSALSFPAAQGSVIEDVHVELGDGLRGLYGTPGSGGSVSHVSVSGGQIGVELSRTVNGGASNGTRGPSMQDVVLTGQRRYAILHGELDALTVVGATIDMAPGAKQAVACPFDVAREATNLTLIDSVIRFPALEADNAAILCRGSVYAKNVHAQNASAFLIHDRSVTDVLVQPGVTQAGQWRHVDELAHGTSYVRTLSGIDYPVTQQVHVDGAVQPAFARVGAPSTDPPLASVTGQHRLVEPTAWFFDPRAVNARAAPYGAAGDGVTDDTAALQAALTQSEVVFLPKGIYRVSQPLALRSDQKLVGLGTISLLLADAGSATFSNGNAPAPMLRSADDAAATTQLSFLELNPNERAKGAVALDWRAGGTSVIRNLPIHRESDLGFQPQTRYDLQGPMVHVHGHGGGRWYNFNCGYYTAFVPGYRHILVEGVTGPLRFYHLNPEGGRGEAMVELRSSQNVDIFHMKVEGELVPLWIRGSDRINVYSRTGNGYPIKLTASYPAGFTPYTPSYFRVEQTPRVRMTNLTLTAPVGCDDATPQTPGCGGNPDEWTMVLDIPGPPGSAGITSGVSNGPILYLRGDPATF